MRCWYIMKNNTPTSHARSHHSSRHVCSITIGTTMPHSVLSYTTQATLLLSPLRFHKPCKSPHVGLTENRSYTNCNRGPLQSMQNKNKTHTIKLRTLTLPCYNTSYTTTIRQHVHHAPSELAFILVSTTLPYHPPRFYAC